MSEKRSGAAVFQTILEGEFYSDYDQSVADLAVLREALMTPKSSIVLDTFDTADCIHNGRDRQDILNYLATEYGELMEEHIIAQGKSYKDPGKDGIVGEAVDMIVCLLDLIHHEQPDLTEAELQEVFRKKLNKWDLKHNY